MKNSILIAIVLALILLLPTIVSAETTIIPVTYEVSVDFQGERDFRLLMPNGYERHFFWNSNQTHTDTTFSHTLFHELDETKYCTSSNEQLEQYKNISIHLVEMLDTCKLVVGNSNKTQEYLNKYTAAEELRLESRMMWKICESDRKKAVNSSSEYKEERDEYESKYNSCDNSLRNYKDDSTQLRTCEAELTQSKSDKNTYALFALIIGVGIGYFIWGRKTQSGPSEQAEAGYVPDRIRPRENQNSSYPRFDDEPRA